MQQRICGPGSKLQWNNRGQATGVKWTTQRNDWDPKSSIGKPQIPNKHVPVDSNGQDCGYNLWIKD